MLGTTVLQVYFGLIVQLSSTLMMGVIWVTLMKVPFNHLRRLYGSHATTDDGKKERGPL